jgi:hypothetical protein
MQLGSRSVAPDARASVPIEPVPIEPVSIEPRAHFYARARTFTISPIASSTLRSSS